MTTALENMGVVHYDVPDEISRFGSWLRSSLRVGHALPASKSVWLFNWADLPRLQGILDMARAKYMQKYPEDTTMFSRLKFAFLKFDNATAEQAYQMALTGLTSFLEDIRKSVLLQVRKAAKTGEAISKGYQREFVKRVREAKILAVAFKLMDDVVGPLDETWKMVEDQVGTEIAAKIVAKLEKEAKKNAAA
jgi:hypothetical protein